MTDRELYECGAVQASAALQSAVDDGRAFLVATVREDSDETGLFIVDYSHEQLADLFANVMGQDAGFCRLVLSRLARQGVVVANLSRPVH